MTELRTLVLAVIVATALFAVPLSATGATTDAAAEPHGEPSPATTAPTDTTPLEPAVAQTTERDDPETNETVGYVEGYWYDDELDVDDGESAALSPSELEAVVYRSMARVEVIRELTFEEAVEVDVISREAFDEEVDELFGGEDDRLVRNVHAEALFMVDRETDALEEYEALYSGAVAGYYDPVTDEVVLVSDSPEEPEVDEVILGHELLHALQDQRFDLQRYEKGTQDQAHAKDGLIEGDAVLVERAYEERCGGEWSCVLPSAATTGPPSYNVGLFLTLFHPYSDGPVYVDHLRDEGGWDAVDDAYDEPPASSAEVIRPGDDREPAAIDHDDRSSDRWDPVDDGRERVGEAGMASMFMHQALESDEATLAAGDVYDDGLSTYDYDHELTDGWAGDELVVYATEENAIEESGYVWETEWLDEDHAEQFLAGYLELLEAHGAESVDDRADTYAIDGAFPGAYALEADGESVTIVRAPTVDELSEIRSDAGTAGEDSIDVDDDADDGVGSDDDGAGGAADRLPGFGPGVAVAAVLGLALLATRRS
ncbi:Hvo_1808 family surface protein [Natrononativus amylolyticus]|uniref:Hvo_1808 family surface protein n=1 Tax=Natrononativus amylolyticus TaxID=2963434 RepID=UPI0020CD0921|nr:Hvo_1808 family surface protein [Natrononativus amylolyticus]